MKLFIGMLFTCTVILGACSNNQAVFVPAPQDADKGSLVYIYRPSASSNFMMSPMVVIDGNEEFKIGGGDYRYIYLQPGKHAIGLAPTDKYSTREAVSLVVEPGANNYLRVKTSLKLDQDKTMYTRTFWLEHVEEKTALDEIRHTDYSDPVDHQVAEKTVEDTAIHEGFSVDKTRDPFAGKH